MKKSINAYFCKEIDSKEKIKAIKNAGYDEFFVGIYKEKETLSWKDQIEYGTKLGLRCSMIHCYYKEHNLNNFWLNNSLGEEVTNSYLKQLEDCHEYTKNFVVHLNGSKESVVSEIGLERIKKLLKVCEKYDVNLCIENLYSEIEIPYIFENIHHRNLKICLDYGHRNFLTPDFDIMKEYGKFVSVLHIHDNYGKTDEHLPIYKGNIDWNYVAAGLRDKIDIVLSSEIKLKQPEMYKDILKENLKGLNFLEKLILNSEKDNDFKREKIQKI